MIQALAHYGMHLGLPVILTFVFYRYRFWPAFAIMMSGMLIDLDHLFATPVFDPNRCSIDFHPLHSYYAIVIYVLMLVPKKTRIMALGLIAHIVADSVDCWLMQ